MGNITDAEWQALWVSVSVAGTGLLVTMPLALLTGWALARWTFWGKTALDILVHLPLVMPPVALGYLLLGPARAMPRLRRRAVAENCEVPGAGCASRRGWRRRK